MKRNYYTRDDARQSDLVEEILSRDSIYKRIERKTNQFHEQNTYDGYEQLQT